jgi:predicted Fe-S protein YdhL (DUF1289 family)
MSEPKLSRAEIEATRGTRNTPCVGACNTFYAEECHACGRTTQEKATWVKLSPDEKDQIWERLIRRGWQPRVGIHDPEA